MQSETKRSLPAICDLQGDFQKLQGEPILLPGQFAIGASKVGTKALAEPGRGDRDRSLTQGAFVDYSCTSMRQQKAQWNISAIKSKKRFSGFLVRVRSGAMNSNSASSGFW